MVVRTPPKQKKIDAPLNPILLREPVKKVDQCMARLQDLQYTVAGGTKVVSGETLSPRSTRVYLRTSLRCKQESLRYLSPLLSVSSLFPPLFGSWENEYYIIYQFIYLPFPLNQTEPYNLKVHTVLCNEVKNIDADSIPGPEVYDALLFLGIEYETLKKKYLEESELLKKKYLEECLERKRLHNEVIELKGSIRVFCRCRPLNQAEIANGSTSIVDFDSSRENELQIICSDSSKKQFKFDHVFRPGSDQEAVFAQTSAIVTSVLDGYNVCVFAYGQTGTGKTFTMEGTPENRGVNYRTLEELFRISRERSNIINYELFVSMLEVYNEKIRDLLVEKSNQPPKKLEVKQAAEGTQEVPGLVEARVYGTDEVWGLLQSGSRNRSVGSTNANELSSRSHCLLRVTVKGENLVNGERTSSHLWLVDLAGSERVGRIEAEGERLKESQFINKSLSALGDELQAHSYSTKLSRKTLTKTSKTGGDCKTLMFVQISPSAADLGETLCSLNFASRVRGIGCGPVRKQADLTELFKYKQLAEKLKHEEKETKKLQDVCRSLQEKWHLISFCQLLISLHANETDS
uniref:Kinesin-like protein n=1 Tax=Vitis vinifera TaxID=29760 RepID=F6HYZ4_VITVI